MRSSAQRAENIERPTVEQIAEVLGGLYERKFGGKDRGRYRISRKLLYRLAARERLPAELLQRLSDELFEQGFILIDMETFFVLLEQRLFRNYRRVPEAALTNEAVPKNAT